MEESLGSVEIELNPKERRVYDRLRAKLLVREADEPSGLGDVLLLLPDLTVLLWRLMQEDRVPLGGKALALLGVGYVFSPLDLIPEIILGPILGPLTLLDDFVVLAAVTSRLLNYVHPDIVRMHWPGQGDALEAIQKVSNWVESQVSKQFRSVVNRLMGRKN